MNTSTKSAKILRILTVGLTVILLCFSYLCLFSALWYVRVFGRTGFDSVLHTLLSGFDGVQTGMVSSYLISGAVPTFLATALTALLLFAPFPKALRVKLWGKMRQLFPFSTGISGIIALVLCLSMLIFSACHVGLTSYVANQLQVSELYLREYKDPKDVAVTFPEEKRNLIYIFLESMETSYFSTQEGGALPYNLIPELYTLAQTHTNFSHNEAVGGFSQVSGASWTVGAMVAQTGGVPLVTPIGTKDWQNGYGKDGIFLPGLTSLQNILHENGYYQALMVGSDSRFGGRKTYYNTHDTDKIYDLYTARKDGLVPSDYFVWWGYEDFYLFDYAKEALTEISQQEQPFAFTMLTVDTHHIGGYTCQFCDDTYEESYENAIACSSRQVVAFVNWIMAQPFFENTTVIVTGDHQSMDAGYFNRNVDSEYNRHMYNCFINAAAHTDNTKNRQFTTLDMFPTTLAALGCTIEGDRLGLGVNLYSDTPTLSEQMGWEALNAELSKRSDYYNRFYEP